MYYRSVGVIVRCLVLKQPDCMSRWTGAIKGCDNLAEGTWQAVVVCRVCALCCLCTAVIWLFENLHNSVVLAQRVRWPHSQSQLLQLATRETSFCCGRRLSWEL